MSAQGKGTLSIVYVLNMINLTNMKLYLLQSNCFRFTWVTPLLSKQSEYVSTQDNETMSLHVCIKCVLFEEYKVALVAIKLFFGLFVWLPLYNYSSSVFGQDKEMLSLRASIQLAICLI